MKRLYLLPLIFLLLNITICVAETPRTRVGVIVPLTGALAQIGESLRDGFVLWNEQNPDAQFEFVLEDDQFQPSKSASAAQKLISKDKVQALVTFTSGPGMAVAPIAERAKVPHFCLTVDSRLARGHYNFVHLFQSRDGARRLLQKFQKEQITKVGILRFIEDAAQLSSDELKLQSKEFGVDVLFEETFPAGTTDFRAVISKTSQSEAQAVMIIALPPELEILARQLKELRFRPRLTTIEMFSVSSDPKLFEGLWFANPLSPDGDYVSRFTKRFNAPVRWGHYADNIAALLKSAKQTQSAGIDLATALSRLKDIPSTVGPLSADSEGIFAVPVVIAEIRNGRAELVER